MSRNPNSGPLRLRSRIGPLRSQRTPFPSAGSLRPFDRLRTGKLRTGGAGDKLTAGREKPRARSLTDRLVVGSPLRTWNPDLCIQVPLSGSFPDAKAQPGSWALSLWLHLTPRLRRDKPSLDHSTGSRQASSGQAGRTSVGTSRNKLICPRWNQECGINLHGYLTNIQAVLLV